MAKRRAVILREVQPAKKYADSDNAFAFVFSDDIHRWYGRQKNLARYNRAKK